MIMRANLSRWVQMLFGLVGTRVVRTGSLLELQQRTRLAERRLQVMQLLGDRPVDEAFRILSGSHAQLQQDVFALTQRNFVRSGYFVEFGAANGLHHSNTLMLEAEYGWSGILAEPATGWHDSLARNRPRAHVDRRCVWSRSGDELRFIEPDSPELSSLVSFAQLDGHRSARRNGLEYSVQTISLDDLLAEYDAPTDIDYLSLDTEGSEFEILAAHDFSSRRIHVITCEHNYSPIRERVHRLLVDNGYERLQIELSLWDDWYVLKV